MMKKTFYVVLVFIILAPGNIFAQENDNKITLTFPRGITLELTRDWEIVHSYPDKYTTIITRLDEIKVDHKFFNDNFFSKNDTITIRKHLKDDFILINIRFFKSMGEWFHQEYANNHFDPVINGNELTTQLRSEVEQQGLTLEDCKGFSVISLNNISVITYRYYVRMPDSQILMKNWSFAFPLGDNSFYITFSHMHGKTPDFDGMIIKIMDSLKLSS